MSATMPLRLRPWRSAWIVVFVVIVASALLPVARADAASTITGGGSSFAALEIDDWKADVARDPYGLRVNYVSQGSTFGRQEFIQGHLDFGASDITFQPPEIPQLRDRRCGGRPADTGCFVYVPVTAGGLALMFNLIDNSGRRVTDLKLNRQTACKIFTGVIKRWNDPEIVATNPSFAGFARDIIPVIRSDGAGESFVFSQFCIAVAKGVWDAFVAERVRNDPSNIATDFRAGSPVSNWPQNWGRSVPQPFADGTASAVADAGSGRDAITYVANGYAVNQGFPVASLQNAAGAYTQPTETNVTIALGYATGRGDGTFNLNFTGPDARAYFPSTYSYIIGQTGGFDPGKGATLGQFLCYAVSAGQVDAPSNGYARLSAPLVNIAMDAIVQIPGAPPRNGCFVAGAPPPPPPPGAAGQGGGGSGGTNEDPAAAAATAKAQAEAAAAAKAAKEAERKAKAARARQVSLDSKLAEAAVAQSTTSTPSAIWFVFAGAGLAAAGSLLVRRRWRSSP